MSFVRDQFLEHAVLGEVGFSDTSHIEVRRCDIVAGMVTPGSDVTKEHSDFAICFVHLDLLVAVSFPSPPARFGCEVGDSEFLGIARRFVVLHRIVLVQVVEQSAVPLVLEVVGHIGNEVV